MWRGWRSLTCTGGARAPPEATRAISAPALRRTAERTRRPAREQRRAELLRHLDRASQTLFRHRRATQLALATPRAALASASSNSAQRSQSSGPAVEPEQRPRGLQPPLGLTRLSWPLGTEILKLLGQPSVRAFWWWRLGFITGMAICFGAVRSIQVCPVACPTTLNDLSRGGR